MLAYIKDIYYSLIFLADQKYNRNPFLMEKLLTIGKLLSTFAPVAFILNLIHLWFSNNKEFVSGFLVIVFLNAFVGLLKHHKTNTFNWSTFFKKTSLMLLVVSVVYVLLSIVGKFAGDSIVSEGFQILVQVMTLFYPASKALKSIFVLSDGDYPPKWIMNKVYNFEEKGNIKDLFDTDKNEENSNSNNPE